MPSKKAPRIGRVVGRRIRELREERGWDQVDLEAHLDGHVKRATLSLFENAKRMPSLATVQRLADAFEVEPASLFLDPSEARHRAALAVLGSSEATLARITKIVGTGD